MQREAGRELNPRGLVFLRLVWLYPIDTFAVNEGAALNIGHPWGRVFTPQISKALFGIGTSAAEAAGDIGMEGFHLWLELKNLPF